MTLATPAESELGETGSVEEDISIPGTRKRTDYWKTGFYYIAQHAKVRLLLVFADWKRKIVV